MSKTFEVLGKALDRQSYEWLLEADQDIANAVAAEVKSGASPDEIRRFILVHVGPDRSGLAARCQSAARYLESTKA
jgi:hypothetical protein